MAVTDSSGLRVGRSNLGYVVFVFGRGTMLESPALHDFAMKCVDSENCTLAIDLMECEYLDSTFLGCLVDLHRCFRRDKKARYQVIANAACSQRLLAATQLQKFLPVSDRPQQTIADCVELLSSKLERKEFGHHVMECHRRLAELGGPNQVVFERIAKQLAGELEDLQQDPAFHGRW